MRRLIFRFFLLGLAACGVAVIRSAAAFASSYANLYEFTGGKDGGAPTGGIVMDSAGTLYGETPQGGGVACHAHHGNPGKGCGTVYRLSATGVFTTLVAFTGPNGAYGYSTLNLHGHLLVGATANGGTSDLGVLFSVSTDGSKFRLLHQFNGTDGENPSTPLVAGGNGVFYGITGAGGPGYPTTSDGVLFSIDTKGNYTIVHAFSGPDGRAPSALLKLPDGVLIGSTHSGGGGGNGVIYTYNPKNGVFAVINSFTRPGSFKNPILGSVDAQGIAYGTNNGPLETGLFSIDETGRLMTLATYSYEAGDMPESGPLLMPDGSLVGTDYAGIGVVPCGVLYQESNGTVTDPLPFGGAFGNPPQETGCHPSAQPLLTPTGSLIGTVPLSFTGAPGGIWEYTP